MNSEGHIQAVAYIFKQVFSELEKQVGINKGYRTQEYGTFKKKLQSLEDLENPFSDISRDKRSAPKLYLKEILKETLLSKTDRELLNKSDEDLAEKEKEARILAKGKKIQARELSKKYAPEIVFSESNFIKRWENLKDAKVISGDLPNLTSWKDIETALKKLFAELKITKKEEIDSYVGSLNENKIEEITESENNQSDDEEAEVTTKDELNYENTREELKEDLNHFWSLLREKNELDKSKLKKAKNINEIETLLNNSVVILKPEEECDLCLRPNHIRFLKLIKSLNKKANDFRDFLSDPEFLKKHILFENEIVESAMNLEDVALCGNIELPESMKSSEEIRKLLRTKKDNEIREYFTTRFSGRWEDLKAVENAPELLRKIAGVNEDNEGEALIHEQKDLLIARFKKNREIAESLFVNPPEGSNVDKYVKENKSKARKAKNVKSLKEFDFVFVLTNEEIKEYERKRSSNICDELDFQSKDAPFCIIEGAIAPDLFDSKKGFDRHHFPRVVPKTNPKYIYCYRETFMKYCNAAIEHIYRSVKAEKENEQRYEYNCALFDFAVFTHYYLDALVRRTLYDKVNKGKHALIDNRLKSRIAEFFDPKNQEEKKERRFLGNWEIFIHKEERSTDEDILEKVKQEVYRIINEIETTSKGGPLRSFQIYENKQRKDKKDRYIPAEEEINNTLEEAFKHICKVGAWIFVLRYYFITKGSETTADIDAAPKANWLESFWSWLVGNANDPKNWPAWTLESTEPRSLKFMIKAKFSRNEKTKEETASPIDQVVDPEIISVKTGFEKALEEWKTSFEDFAEKLSGTKKRVSELSQIDRMKKAGFGFGKSLAKILNNDDLVKSVKEMTFQLKGVTVKELKKLDNAAKSLLAFSENEIYDIQIQISKTALNCTRIIEKINPAALQRVEEELDETALEKFCDLLDFAIEGTEDEEQDVVDYYSDIKSRLENWFGRQLDSLLEIDLEKAKNNFVILLRAAKDESYINERLQAWNKVQCASLCKSKLNEKTIQLFVFLNEIVEDGTQLKSWLLSQLDILCKSKLNKETTGIFIILSDIVKKQVLNYSSEVDSRLKSWLLLSSADFSDEYELCLERIYKSANTDFMYRLGLSLEAQSVESATICYLTCWRFGDQCGRRRLEYTGYSKYFDYPTKFESCLDLRGFLRELSSRKGLPIC